MTFGRFLALAAILPFFPATAATVVFGGSAQVRLGYADNPFLERDPPGSSIQVAGTISPRLTRTTSLGQTILSGAYDRAEYLSHYSHSDSISAALQQSQQFSERLKGAASVRYSSSLNPFLGSNLDQSINPGVVPQTGLGQSIVDQLTVGQRSRSISGNAGLDWTPTARDFVSVSGNYQHSTYGGRSTLGALASDYTAYGGALSYTRAFGGRTRLGVQFAVNHTDSGLYGSTTSYQPNFIVQQTLSQYWAFNGSVGGIFQRSSGPFSRSSNSLGFNGSLCGTYPRHSVCFNGSRQTSASGIGGLRTDLQFGTTLNFKIDQRSSVSATAQITNSKSAAAGLAPIIAGNQKFRQAGADYNRQLTDRISAGFGGRYQERDYPTLGKAHAVSATLNISAQFGRTQ